MKVFFCLDNIVSSRTRQVFLSALMMLVGACETVFVSPEGDDGASGGIDDPLASIEAAKLAVRAINDNMDSDIVVYLREGTYSIADTLEFTPEDSGSNGFNVVYKPYGSESVIISGGDHHENSWTQHDGEIYVTTLERSTKLRQLYINGQRAYMSKGAYIDHSDGVAWGEYTVVGDEEWALEAGSSNDGVSFTDFNNLPLYNNPDLVEIHSKSGFAYHIVGLRDITEEDGLRVAKFQQPMGAIAAKTPQIWGAGFFYQEYGSDRLFHFENAYELLDEEGEYYFDVYDQKLYYYKRASDDMGTAEVVVPRVERLIKIAGESTADRVSNIVFERLAFMHDHWSLMDVDGSKGASTVQSLALQTKYTDDGNWHDVEYSNCDMQPAAVEIQNAEYIQFRGNAFQHLGAVGINVWNDCLYCEVSGNYFEDIGSAAVNVGDHRHIEIGNGDIDNEGVCIGVSVTENRMENCVEEFLCAPGISVMITNDCDVSYNHLSGLPYSGISMGWGWVNFDSDVVGNNSINYNIVAKTMEDLHDGGAIYTLANQPGSEIVGNYVADVLYGPGIYLDQGTAELTVSENVVENINGLWLNVWGTAAMVENCTITDNYSNSSSEIGIQRIHNVTASGNFYTANQDRLDYISAAGPQAAKRGIVPLAHWTVLSSSSTELEDISGNGYNGTLNNTSQVSGYDGGTALNFDGNASNVVLPSAPFSQLSDQVTLSAWVYGASVQPYPDTFLEALDGSGNVLLNLHLPWADGTVIFDAGGDRITYTPDESQYKNAWNHWVFTKNVDAGVMKIYVNGALVSATSRHSGEMSGIESVTLCSNSANLYNYRGSIDDVRLYDRILSEDEISALYTNTPNAIAHWACNDNDGEEVSDITGNGYIATHDSADWGIGIKGGALQFNGVDSYLDLPLTPFSELGGIVGLSLWEKSSGSSVGVTTLAEAVDTDGNTVFEFTINEVSGMVSFSAGEPGATIDTLQTSVDGVAESGFWNHWFCSKNSYTGVMSIYLNGVLIAESTNSYQDLQIDGAVRVGANSSTLQGYSGTIDDIRLYHYEVSADQVTSLYTDAASQNAYVTWVSSYGTLAGESDTDGDGVSNFQEFAFGSDPTVRESDLVLVGYDSSNFTVSHRILDNYESQGVSYTTEYSLDLENWIELSNDDAVFSVSANGITGISDKVMSIDTATQAAVFYRVVVSEENVADVEETSRLFFDSHWE